MQVFSQPGKTLVAVVRERPADTDWYPRLTGFLSRPVHRKVCGWLMLCSLLIGCSGNDDITRYTVAHSSHEEAFAALEKTGLHPGTVVPTRILAAIVPRRQQTWFFKLQGPDEDVAGYEPAFDELIRSVQFSEETDQPAWETPAGWKQQPGSGMRFATLLVGPDEHALELTVIPLATGTGSLSDYVLANINRWRGQLGLPEISSSELETESPSITQVPLANGMVATVVKLTGESTAEPPMSMSSGLPQGHPPLAGSALPSPTGSDEVRQLQYVAPPGWSIGTVSGMRQAAFEVADGDQSVEITVINLPVSGGDRLSNVNRWREQIGLTPLTSNELARVMESIEIDGLPGEFVQLAADESQQYRQAVLGALVDDGGKTWFFKLMGDADLALQEQATFLEFLQSVSFVR